MNTKHRVTVFLLALYSLFSHAASYVNQYGVAVPDDYTYTLDIPYTQTEDWTGYMDLYRPVQSARPTPVVINFHGGGWDHNNKEQEGGWTVFFRNHVAVVNVCYRLTPEQPAPAAVEDVCAAVRFVRQNARRFNIDPERIVTMGTSAGGHLALMAGYKEHVAGVIDMYGVPDMLAYMPLSSSPRKWIGQANRTDTTFIQSMSPLCLVESTTPPTLMIHGDADDVVPYAQSVALQQRLNELGIYNCLMTIPGGKHGRFESTWKKAVEQNKVDFLRHIGVLPRTDVTQCGVIADGRTLNTVRLQQLIDSLVAADGGELYFPSGIYLTGGLVLGSRLTLHLDSGAILLGSTSLEDYPVHIPAFVSHTNRYNNRSLLYAENAHHLAIIGQGMIDGQGDHPAFQADLNDPLLSIKLRPYVIRMVGCNHIRLQDIHLQRSPAWMQQYLNCTELVVNKIHVENNVNYNNDGLDIDCTSHVRINNCTILSDDDGICMKATNANGKTEDVQITNCTILSNCNAVKIGSETNGNFSNIIVRHCSFDRPEFPTHYARVHRCLAGLAFEITDGGTIDGIHASNIHMNGVISPIFIRLADRGRNYYDGGPSQPIGHIRNITISDVDALSTDKIPSAITAVKGAYVEHITLSNVHIQTEGGGSENDIRWQQVSDIPEMEKSYPENLIFSGVPCFGMFLRHVRDLVFDHVSITASSHDARPVYAVDDVHNWVQK